MDGASLQGDRIQRHTLLVIHSKRNNFFTDTCLSLQKAKTLLEWNSIAREMFFFPMKKKSLLGSVAWLNKPMTQTLETYQTPNFEKTSLSFISAPLNPNCQTITHRLRQAIARLERQDIGWLDILTAMANIAAEEEGEEQVAKVLEATAFSLKRHRKVRRDL